MNEYLDSGTPDRKLDPDIKSMWVKALRSGEYNQGRGRLKSVSDTGCSYNYCCLGVLGDLLVSNGDAEWEMPMNSLWVKGYNPSSYSINSELLNGISVARKTTTAANVTLPLQDFLVHANDDLKASFIDIANWIEEKL